MIDPDFELPEEEEPEEDEPPPGRRRYADPAATPADPDDLETTVDCGIVGLAVIFRFPEDRFFFVDLAPALGDRDPAPDPVTSPHLFIGEAVRRTARRRQ